MDVSRRTPIVGGTSAIAGAGVGAGVAGVPPPGLTGACTLIGSTATWVAPSLSVTLSFTATVPAFG